MARTTERAAAVTRTRDHKYGWGWGKWEMRKCYCTRYSCTGTAPGLILREGPLLTRCRLHCTIVRAYRVSYVLCLLACPARHK